MISNDCPSAKTVKEAKDMLDMAIANGEFEKIPFYQHEIEKFTSFEDVLSMDKCSSCITAMSSFKNPSTKSVIVSNEVLDEANQNSAKYYKNKVRELKARQKEELEEVFQRWSDERNKISDKFETEFERSFGTAKIIAQQGKVQKAIDMRDEALIKKEEIIAENKKKIDEKYKKLCDLMTMRHKAELDALIENRKAEMKGFRIIQEEAESKIVSDFIVDNASSAIDISKRFGGKSKNSGLSSSLNTRGYVSNLE